MTRRTLSQTIVLIAAALTIGITPAAGAGKDSAVAAAEKQIRRALAQWVDAANRGDFAAALSVWAPDMIGWAPSGPDDTYEREAAFAKNSKPSASTTNVRYALEVNEVIVEGSLAVVRDTWTQTVQKNGENKDESFRSFEVWRRQADGAWKISRWIDGPMQDAARHH